MCLCSGFRVVMAATIPASKRCSVCLSLQLFVGWIMSYLRYLCLFAHSVLCFWIVGSPFFFRLVYPMLPVSLVCPFLIATSVFSNVYFFVFISEYEGAIPIRSYTGSIVDKDLVNRACKGTDSVLHVASLVDATMFPNEKLLHEINVKGNTSFHYFYDENHRSRDTKGVSEYVNRSRTYKTMTKRKKDKQQYTKHIHQTKD